MTNLERYDRELNKLEERRRQRKATLDAENGELASLTSRLGAATAAQTLFQEVAKAVQRSANERIAAIVGMCLRAVFGEDAYGFELRFDAKRGRTESSMVFTRNGAALDDPLNEVGGGVVDVAAYALRLADVVLSLPAGRRFLALDEPFRFVAKRFRAGVREMLLRSVEELGMQVVLVTHIEDFQVGKLVELE